MTRVLIVDDDDLMRAGLVELLGVDPDVTIVGEAATGRQAIEAARAREPDGASGFLLKRTRPEDLIAAVHTIANGDSLLSPSVTRRVIDRMAQQPTPDHADQTKLDDLTPRERDVLEALARGMSNREIAAALVVEESTVRTHVKRILMKLHLRDRVQAVIFAYETGLNPSTATANPPDHASSLPARERTGHGRISVGREPAGRRSRPVAGASPQASIGRL